MSIDTGVGVSGCRNSVGIVSRSGVEVSSQGSRLDDEANSEIADGNSARRGVAVGDLPTGPRESMFLVNLALY